MNGSPFCRRCGAEIATANLLEIDPGVDYNHFALVLIDGRRRQLSPAEWRLFTALYQRHGRIVGTVELAAAAQISGHGVRDEIFRLRTQLTRSRFQIVTHRAHGYELIVRSDV